MLLFLRLTFFFTCICLSCYSNKSSKAAEKNMLLLATRPKCEISPVGDQSMKSVHQVQSGWNRTAGQSAKQPTCNTKDKRKMELENGSICFNHIK